MNPSQQSADVANCSGCWDNMLGCHAVICNHMFIIWAACEFSRMMCPWNILCCCCCCCWNICCCLPPGLRLLVWYEVRTHTLKREVQLINALRWWKSSTWNEKRKVFGKCQREFQFDVAIAHTPFLKLNKLRSKLCTYYYTHTWCLRQWLACSSLFVRETAARASSFSRHKTWL